MTKTYYVEIYRDSDGHVERRMGPMSKAKADRVEVGVLLAFNHDEWSVRIVEADQ